MIKLLGTMLAWVALTSTITATATRTYRIGGLAIKGEATLFSQWNETFSTFLTEQLESEDVVFELVPLDFSSTYTSVASQAVDFVYTNPSVFSCLESEYKVRAIVSQNNLRAGKELYSFGGSVIALKSRTDITNLTDIQDKVVEAVSISGLGACQMQWNELKDRNIEFLIEPKEIRFSKNQKKIVKDVISGNADIGFVRTDLYETMEINNEIESGLIKVVEPRDFGPDSTFPFESTTELYPEWSVGVLQHVNETISKLVVEALFQIQRDSTAAIRGKYSSWIPPLSYLPLNKMQRTLKWIDDKGACMRSDNLYDALVCPDGYVILSKEAVDTSCDGVSATPCPDGYDCICRPCRKVPPKHFTVSIKLEQNDSSSNKDVDFYVNKTFEQCDKLSSCESSLRSSEKFIVHVTNNWYDIPLLNTADNFIVEQVEIKFHGAIDPSTQQLRATPIWAEAMKKPFGVYELELEATKNGRHLVEVQVNGEQVAVSPLILTVDVPIEQITQDMTIPFVIGGVLGGIIVIGAAVFAVIQYRQYKKNHEPIDFQAEFDRLVAVGEMYSAAVPREIRRRDLQQLDQIGKGAFGLVHKSLLNEMSTRQNPAYIVATKTAPKSEATELIAEAAAMMQVSGHDNLVSIIGVVTIGEPLILVIQFCEHGSLYSKLKTTFAAGDEIPVDQKMYMAHEIADGMDFLGTKKCVHRDLASRNVLLASGQGSLQDLWVCKIADFGLSRKIEKIESEGGEAGSNYYRSNSGIFPVRWTAPEAMEAMRFTVASDVWSFGIVVIELFLNAETPYQGTSNPAVIKLVVGGGCHPQPQNCPDNIYGIISQCWLMDSTKRPQFLSLSKALKTAANSKMTERKNSIDTILSTVGENHEDHETEHSYEYDSVVTTSKSISIGNEDHETEHSYEYDSVVYDRAFDRAFVTTSKSRDSYV